MDKNSKMLLKVTFLGVPNWDGLFVSITLYHKQTTTTMKKILTLAAIAIIFASNFANASTLTMGNGGKTIFTSVKTSKNVKSHVKISAKEFSIKGMQDTKDILMQILPIANA
jgi:hypothetical protein